MFIFHLASLTIMKPFFFSSLLNPAVAEVSSKELKGESGILQGSNLIGMKTNDVSLVA